MSDLLPCPFCGGEVKIDTKKQHINISAREAQSTGLGVSAGGITITTYVILCECGIKIESQSRERMTERWNRRFKEQAKDGAAG